VALPLACDRPSVSLAPVEPHILQAQVLTHSVKGLAVQVMLALIVSAWVTLEQPQVHPLGFPSAAPGVVLSVSSAPLVYASLLQLCSSWTPYCGCERIVDRIRWPTAKISDKRDALLFYLCCQSIPTAVYFQSLKLRYSSGSRESRRKALKFHPQAVPEEGKSIQNEIELSFDRNGGTVVYPQNI
jgi:hypothetical protein